MELNFQPLAFPKNTDTEADKSSKANHQLLFKEISKEKKLLQSRMKVANLEYQEKSALLTKPNKRQEIKMSN